MQTIEKIKKIESISKFELFSIVYLCECLTDNSLEVRYSAHQKLRSTNLDPTILSVRQSELINLGVLLNSGDVVWSVYQSGLDYDDNFYGIYDLTDDSGNQNYGRAIDSSQYDLWNRGVACKLISTHIDRESAETVAHQVAKNLLARGEFPYFSDYVVDLKTKISQQDIYNWAKIYNIAELPQPSNSDPFNWIDNTSNLNKFRREKYKNELYCYEEQLHKYAGDVLEHLNIDDHYDVIDRIYSNIVGRLAYVCKEIVRETAYFIP